MEGLSKLLLLPLLATGLSSCSFFVTASFGASTAEDLYLGEVFVPEFEGNVAVAYTGDAVKPYGAGFLAVKAGEATVTLSSGNKTSDIVLTVTENPSPELSFALPEGLQVLSTDAVYVSEGTAADTEIRILEGENRIAFEGFTAEGVDMGTVKAVAYYDGMLSNVSEIEVLPFSTTPDSLEISAPGLLEVGGTYRVETEVHPSADRFRVNYEVVSGGEYLTVSEDGTLSPVAEGKASVRARVGSLYSNTLYLEIAEGEDPYEGVSASEFYRDYEPSTSYEDTFYRTRHGFMSGSIELPRYGAPETSAYQPSQNGTLLRNTSDTYGDGELSYTVLDAYGEEAYTVYYGGGYVTPEEVGAYILAFGEVPANYVSDKSVDRDDPRWELWDEYLRLNNSYFSGDITEYPHEPALPDAAGNGGNISYYEIDIGGSSYNRGYATGFTRGTLRIVYSRYLNGKEIADQGDRYVFYTYDHYADFQEFLNYEGGWGKRFGSSGGTTAPTAYPETIKADFSAL